LSDTVGPTVQTVRIVTAGTAAGQPARHDLLDTRSEDQAMLIFVAIVAAQLIATACVLFIVEDMKPATNR
jgi:hypothetical protein